MSDSVDRKGSAKGPRSRGPYSSFDADDEERFGQVGAMAASTSGGPSTVAGRGSTEFQRKRSLVRPERERMDPGHRLYHYTQLAAQQADHIAVQTQPGGIDPVAAAGEFPMTDMPRSSDESGDHDTKGGRNVYGLNDEVGGYHSQSDSGEFVQPDEYNNNINNNNININNNQGPAQTQRLRNSLSTPKEKLAAVRGGGKPPNVVEQEPLSLWHAYCRTVTFFIPAALLRVFGMKTKDRQDAWREKIGLITVILYVAAIVAFLTFGFTKSVCSNNLLRIRNNEVNDAYLIANGRAFELAKWGHPAAQGIEAGSNILYPPVNAGGMDASFLFQNVNGNCKGLITAKEDSDIPHDSSGNLAWYFPCQLFAQNGTTQPSTDWKDANGVQRYVGYACHTSQEAREQFYQLKVSAEVYFTWDDLKNSTRNLVVYNGNVLDLNLLNFLDKANVNYPKEFDLLQTDKAVRGTDVSQLMATGRDAKIIKCLNEVIKVGYVDTEEIGCIASQVVLYVSLVFIIGLVAVKFLLACYFKWVISGRQGAFYMSRKELEEHNNQVEDWSNDIYQPGPVKAPQIPPTRKKLFALNNPNRGSVTMAQQIPVQSTSKLAGNASIYDASRSSVFLPDRRQSYMSMDTSYRGAAEQLEYDDGHGYQPYGSEMAPAGPYEASLQEGYMNDDLSGSYASYVVPQPPIDFQPFGYPLAHTICLVTAYSESVDGLRTTLDSLATTDYPNSHKLILIICDGIIKGSGNDMSTPEIAISMMTDFVEQPDQVQPHSYVSVVSGSKRHNMAKVYAGFYKYDNETVEPNKQQRVPVITIVKCGSPAEANQPKPGNRGKRDSQVILMSFLQRVMFDERMTELEFEIFNGISRITGIAPDFYEIVLMVDADTKVFPDSITHMVACMVKDPEVMGLCGETKIANKTESWVSMIQVFEYFISHHQAKAFESVFGGVTCLPGCFCMYRIKAPKGDDGFWIPILANPDIVERYSENVVDTLHKKNLLLLGEDRFLSTIMLRTFPKRKQIFVPKAACKTIVPAEFKVLLSQRRRWINSTIHNLMELVLVRDLCGVFCISMQFVVFIDLVSTLVLPAAISFTIYVIIISIVSKPTPTMSLILLALILGLPGVLIVVTASRVSYVGWMAIYLLSLPIWNFVLPMNAYWKFDDFSWGDTRTIQGGDKGGHDEVDGEFDSSQIVMKRWRDFQKEKGRNYGQWQNSYQYFSGSEGSESHSPELQQRPDEGI